MGMRRLSLILIVAVSIIVYLYLTGFYVSYNSYSEDYLALYDYDKSIPLNIDERLVADTDIYRLYKVYFDSVNYVRVPALFMIPKTVGKAPCIVFLHGYGGSKEDALAVIDIAAAEGYAFISIDAVYHGERRVEGRALYSTDINDTIRGFIQTVLDLRRAIDYLETRSEIDRERIGYIGGSMGGIIGAIFIGVEPRVKAAALIVAGGNMSLMVRESEHPAIPPIRRYLEEQGISYEELQSMLDPIDPLNFIARFSPRPIVFHLGRYDRIVPAEAGRQLYIRAGEPKKVYWYDAGHNLPMELVAVRILDFMDENLRGRKLMFYESREFRYMLYIYSPYIALVVFTIIVAMLLMKYHGRIRYMIMKSEQEAS
ncbi:MAG: alpha/beta fold hydrolase [Candidatus Bathyarchaeia archaeon]